MIPRHRWAAAALAALPWLAACSAPARGTPAVAPPEPVAVVPEPEPAPIEEAEPAPAPVPEPAPEPAPACHDHLVDGGWVSMRDADGWVPGLYPYDDYAKGKLVLSFDDGPMKPNTGAVLDLLAERNLHAAFFVNGRAIRGSTYQWIPRVLADGHELGNHTYRHDVRMASRVGKDEIRRYVLAEYELTQIKVDLAMLATSREDFNAMSKRVFGRLRPSSPVEWEIEDLDGILERHGVLLEEHGYALDRRPYRIPYSRPPGGNPFMGGWAPGVRERFAEVVNGLGLVNVFWTSSSGDSDPALEPDVRFDRDRIVRNFIKGGHKGGIILIHDRLDPRTLEAALDAMIADPEIEIVELHDLVEAKYGCTPLELLAARREAEPEAEPEAQPEPDSTPAS